jgi:ribosomal protein S27E
MRPELKLNCISCGHSIALDENVYVDYEGQIKCNACSAILSVKMEDGKLKAMNFVRFSRPSGEDSLLRR